MLRRIALTVGQRSSAISVILVALLAASVARADGKTECVAAADAGQELREKRALVAARKQFIICSQDRCPAVVRRDCTRWEGEVEARVPSVVFAAQDEQSNDLGAVRVLVDGNPLVERLDGASVEVDPGAHTVVFEGSGGKRKSLQVILREGEKNRPLQAVLAGDAPQVAPPSPPPVAGDRPAREGSWMPALIVGAAGVVVVGGSLALGFNGRSDVDHLHESCGGHCADGDVGTAKRKLLFADIGLGIGIVALGVATFLALTRAPTHDSRTVALQSAR